MTIINTFYAPKTSGNTIISLNTAPIHQLSQQNKKIAILQLSSFPDLSKYIGTTKTHNIAELIPFIQTKEWGSDLLTKIKATQGIDLYFSPEINTYENFAEKDLKKILTLITDSYDYLYIDLNYSIPKNLFQKILDISEKIILTTLIDPASMEAMKIFWKNNPKLHKKTKILFNQCPPCTAQKIKKTIKTYETSFLGSLPTEEKYIWTQIYEGFPLAFQKKSKWKKDLEKILPTLINN